MLERLIWIGIGIDTLAGLGLLAVVIKDWPCNWFMVLGVLFMILPALVGYWLLRSNQPVWALVVGFPILWSLPVAIRLAVEQFK